jgi:hypothetical protein
VYTFTFVVALLEFGSQGSRASIQMMGITQAQAPKFTLNCLKDAQHPEKPPAFSRSRVYMLYKIWCGDVRQVAMTTMNVLDPHSCGERDWLVETFCYRYVGTMYIIP